MKNLGVKLSNQELLQIKGGTMFTCHCQLTGLEYVVNVPNCSVEDAEVTLATKCHDPDGAGWCTPDMPF